VENEVLVGMDVSLAQLDGALWPNGEIFRLSNDPAGVAQLLARMMALRPRAVIVEASGGPEEWLVSELGAAEIPVAVVNPRQGASSRAVWGSWPRPIVAMRWCWRGSDTRCTVTAGLP
jgi:transposase